MTPFQKQDVLSLRLRLVLMAIIPREEIRNVRTEKILNYSYIQDSVLSGSDCPCELRVSISLCAAATSGTTSKPNRKSWLLFNVNSFYFYFRLSFG